MNEEQEKLKHEFLRDATNGSNRFTDNQAMFMWNYIMEVMLAMNRMRK